METKKYAIATQHFLMGILITTVYASVIGMEQNTIPIIPFAPQQTMSLFKPNKALKKGVVLDKLFNGNITITPNEKSIIISNNGNVYQKDIVNYFNHQQESMLLFKHPSVTLATMITIDETEDGALLVISGANYYNQERGKWTSEIISYQNESYTIKEFDSPLQALKLSHHATFLAAATLSSVMLFNLKKNTSDTVGFERFNGCYTNCAQQRIIDIDIADDSYVLAIGKYGIMQLMDIKKQTELHFVYERQFDDELTQLTMITPRTALYATKKGEAKIIDMFDFLNKKIKHLTTNFAHSAMYEQVTLDRHSQMSAHWTKNENLSNEERSTIIIYRIPKLKNHIEWDPKEEEIEPHKEQCILRARFNNNSYDCISNAGKLEEHFSHFLTVSLRKSTIVALASTGELFIWKLPISPYYRDDKEKEREITPDTYNYSTDTTTTTTTTTTQRKKSTKKRIGSLGSATARSHASKSHSPSSTPPNHSPKNPREQHTFHKSESK